MEFAEEGFLFFGYKRFGRRYKCLFCIKTFLNAFRVARYVVIYGFVDCVEEVVEVKLKSETEVKAEDVGGDKVLGVAVKFRFYACSLCFKVYKTVFELRSYGRSYIGEKFFFCFECGRRFM